MAFEYLNRYLDKVRQRLMARTVLSGLAIAAAVALLMTLLLVTINYRWDIAEENWNWSRALLFLSLTGVLAFFIVMPLLVLNRRRAAQQVERAVPGLDQRLLTCLENKDANNPMVALVAEQAWEQARAVEPAQLVSTGKLAGFGGAAAFSAAVLAWLILATPGWIGQGSALLWGGVPKGATAFNRSLKVEPGSTKVRRKANQNVTAEVLGFAPASVKIFARFHKASAWEEVPMLPAAGKASSYEFLFTGLADSVDYYVVAGSLKSQQYTLTAVDLPSVKKYKVTYQFPGWSGMANQTEDPGGDLRAVTGTKAYLEFETDKPVGEAVLVMENGTRVPVKSANPQRHLVTVDIAKDGSFHFAMMEDGKAVRLTDDYFIEPLKEGPPELSFEKPQRDLKVSPIEEVAFAVRATDDFGLTSLTLHYSVNGGPEQTVNLPVNRGSKTATGTHQLALEDFKLAPGDNVMFYAKAKDAKSEATTSPYFLEAQPYELEFSQSQQSGGGMPGMQGEQEGNIVQRQKEIISATFMEQRAKKSTGEVREIGKFLGDTQEKLRTQAQTFVQRIRARQLAGQNETIEKIAKEMEAAAAMMMPAAQDLQALKFADALPNEQKALQHLQRAEALRKEVEVAMQQGGGGGGGGAQRDLESLLDLELDTEKNQYETGQQMTAEQKQKEVDEAMKKLEELARRQQELASNAQRNQQTPEQRWQQEMLRREAERLQEELQRMQRNQQQQQQQGQQSQSQQGQQGGQSGASGSSGGQQQQQQRQSNRLQRDPRIEKALENLKEATNDMRRAANNQQNGQGNQGETQRAADRLAEARKLMQQMEQQGKQQQLSDLAQRAEELAQQQKAFENKMRQTFGNQGERQQNGGQPRPMTDPRLNNQLADEKAQMHEKYQRLEKDLQDAARQMRSNQRSASSKLQEGLGEAQKEDLNMKLKMVGEYIRGGYGQYMTGREKEISRALDALSEKVKEAEKMTAGAGPKSDPTEKALAQIEQLRQQIADLSRQQQQGQQGGQQQGGQQGQQGQQKGQQPGQGQQQGQQPGQQGQGQQPGGQQQGQQGQQGNQGGRGQQPGQQQGQGNAQNAQNGGQQRGQGQQQGNQQGQKGDGKSQGQQGGQGRDGAANEFRGGYGDSSPFREGGQMNTGERNYQGPRGMMPSADTMRTVERGFQQSLRDLEQMRGKFSGQAEDQAEYQKLLRDMAALDPSRFRGNPALVEQMRSNLLPVLEQLELKLRRDLEGKEAKNDARSATPDRVPNGYADQVAEYYRRLSKGSSKKN